LLLVMPFIAESAHRYNRVVDSLFISS